MQRKTYVYVVYPAYDQGLFGLRVDDSETDETEVVFKLYSQILVGMLYHKMKGNICILILDLTAGG